MNTNLHPNHAECGRKSLNRFNVFSRRVWPGLVAAMLTAQLSPLAAALPASVEPLRTVAQVRNLTPKEAQGHLPVRLKATVTFWENELHSRFVQDDTAGIYIGQMTDLPELMPGQIVEVEGVTSPGEFAPIIIPKSVTVVGEGKLPAAKTVSVEGLLTGQEDSQLVELSGIVRSVTGSGDPRRYEVELAMSGERFTTFTRDLPVAQMEELVDSTVSVCGVASTLFNRHRQLLGFRILVPKQNDIIIKEPAPADPFKAPAQSVDSLLQFSLLGTFGHRVKVAGTVIYHEPGSALFIQDDKEGVYCQTRDRQSFKPGDRVEVLGFPAKGEYTPVLQDATCRKVGVGTPPAPAVLDVDEILSLSGTHNCRLIQLTGNLLERTERGRERFLVLEHGGFIFHAYLGQDIASGEGFPPMHLGSEVQVTGICLIERGANWRAGESWRANSFRMLLRSPDDVRVQKTPPWWVQFGVGRIIGILAVIILVAILRILYLHRHIDTHLKQQVK